MSRDDDDIRDTRRDETELVLPPGVFAFVLDKTKGNVTTYSGPTKSSLSQTDQPVLFDSNTGRFVSCNIEKALQTNIIARKGEYIILNNATSDNGSQPVPGKAEVLGEYILDVGTTENISGPANFALWPGQTAELVKGHTLRTNQYVLVRVYDEEAAQANWSSAIVKLVEEEESVVADDDESSEGGETPKKVKAEKKPVVVKKEVTPAIKIEAAQLTLGKLLIIKGTDVSFYIPPTGVEVVRDDEENYVRDAVTLERLEYCMLLGENGGKRYVRGPEVVFPTPTEQFVVSSDKGKRKFRAYELNENSGLYIKVIADYNDAEDGNKEDDKKAGDELFMTGKDAAIYFPRTEHAIIKYGDQDKHYAIAIPAGEARYVLKRDTGEVERITGPRMFLPDPRKEVMVRRILDDKTCELYYPGNAEVLAYNQKLRGVAGDNEYAQDSDFESFGAAMAAANLDDGGGGNYTRGFSKTKKKLAAQAEFGDELARGTSFTPPRTITLNTKLDGAVTVDVWTGYAVQVVNKIGDREVIKGPKTVMLKYDEYLEGMTLSRGRPKDPDNTLKTVYLRTMSNPVTDTISVTTNDLIELSIDLKYLVRFTGDESKWFNVDNYVQYMCDHLRSLIGNQVRQIGIQNFYSSAVEQLRDMVLGARGDDGRTNKIFEENDMEIYDVEVLSINFMDHNIEHLLSDAKQEELKNTIRLVNEQRRQELITGQEAAKRGIEAEFAKTAEATDAIEQATATRASELRLVEIENRNTERLRDETGRLASEEEASKVRSLVLEGDKNKLNQKEEFDRKALARRIEELVAEAQADEIRAKAVQPALVQALQALAMSGTLKQMAEHLAPLSIIRNESLSGTLNSMLKGTPMENLLDNIEKLGVNQVIDARTDKDDDKTAA